MYASYVFVTIAIIVQAVAGFSLNFQRLATSPSQCGSTCSSANSTFSSCLMGGGPGPCICDESFLNTLASCFQCAASIEGTTDFSTDQSQLDDVVSACDALGKPIQNITLPGQNPNRVIATSAIASGTPSVSLPNGTHSTASSPPITSGGISSSSSLPLTPSVSSTETITSAALPTSTSPTSNSSSVSSSSTASGSPSSTSSSSSSTSSPTASASSPTGTSGASTFKAISGLSTVLVGAGLVLLF